MVVDGAVSPSLMEDVLGDLAARCAIRAVVAEDGTDLLLPAVEAALTTLTTAPALSPSRAPGARSSVAPPPQRPEARAEPRVTTSVRPEPRPLVSEAPLVDEGPPSSLEDAVMREISDRSPVPGVAHPSSPSLPPIIEPSDLRPRSSNPPANETVAEPEDRAVQPSIPPDAIVPAASEPDATPIAPPPHMEDASAEVEPSPSPSPQAEPPSLFGGLRVAAISFGLLVGFVIGVIRLWGAQSEPPPRLRPPPTISAAPAPPATPSVPLVATPVATPPVATPATPSASAATPSAPTGDEVPPGADVPAGYGLLDVAVPQGVAVQIDGRVVTPPTAVPPGHHRVRVEVNGRAQEYGVDVRAGHVTHARPPTAP
jgi:hypothetical protein